MSDATCKTCPWMGETDFMLPTADVTQLNCCRKNPPPWTVDEMVDPDRDWCGEHPGRRTATLPQSDCERLGRHVCGGGAR